MSAPGQQPHPAAVRLVEGLAQRERSRRPGGSTRRSAAPRSTRARVCSSRARLPRRAPRRRAPGTRGVRRDPGRTRRACGARLRRRRPSPRPRPAPSAPGRARAAAPSPRATCAATAATRQSAITGLVISSSPGAGARVEGVGQRLGRPVLCEAEPGACLEQQRGTEHAGGRIARLPGGGQRRLRLVRLVQLHERVDQERQRPEDGRGPGARPASTRTRAGRRPPRRGRHRWRNRAKARSMQPWASAMSQPRGAAISISASESARAASNSSLRIRQRPRSSRAATRARG